MNYRHPISILILAAGIGLSPSVQAISPPPDGGYPGANTAEGQGALLSLTTGTYNTAVGILSLSSNATGKYNTALGAGTLVHSTSDQNTATGFAALVNDTTGSYNTATGTLTLFSDIEGSNNTAVGQGALFSNTAGGANTGIGSGALSNNTIGSNNIALGAAAGSNLVDCDNNIEIGNPGAAYECDTIRIGTQGIQVETHVAGIYGSTALGGTPVYIDLTGQLGTLTSSRRFKRDIQAMDKASEVILELKPVIFHYKADPKVIPQYGLIAEEVAGVNPDLVVQGNDGQPYTVRYDAVNVMLLNEFLKQHKAFGEQTHKMRELEATVASLLATVKKQAAQLQKVSARVDASRPAPRIASVSP